MPKSAFSYLCTFVIFICLSAASVAQEITPLDSGRLDQQFDFLKNKSESYNQFKVIKRTSLDKFWKNVSDSVTQLKSNQAESDLIISNQKLQVEDLQSKLKNTQQDLASAVEQRDGISFFGTILSKGIYKAIMWSLVAVLAALFVGAAFKFRNSNMLTRQAKRDHEELLAEFEGYKTSAIEKERKIKRELQTIMNRMEEMKKRSNPS